MKVLVCGQSNNTIYCKKSIDRLAKKYRFNIEVEMVSSGKQLLFRIESDDADIDLIYLDYNLEDGNGVELASYLRKKNISTDIVFYTMNENHVDEGYDVEALHYLVKDKIDDIKFENVFLKAMKRARKRNEEVLSLFCAGENRRIDIASIQYFEVKKRIVTVHYGNDDTFDFYSTLSKLEELLFLKGFIRIHQSFLVSKEYILKKTNRTIVMKDTTELPIGRSYQGKI